MTSKALLPALLGLGLALVVVIALFLVHRVRGQRKRIVEEIKERRRSSAAARKVSSANNNAGNNEAGKLFRAKSMVRGQIPEFVIPGTHIKLVQPIITPPSPPARKISTVRQPLIKEIDETGDGVFRARVMTQPAPEWRRDTASDISETDSGLHKRVHRSSSAAVLFSGEETPPESGVQSDQPLASSSPKPKRKAHSRNPSVSSIDLLSINVPPGSLSAQSSRDESAETSSAQSPEDSPRLFRLFRQSKHQIKLTGATVEFSLQYEISKRALVLNVMRVRRVLIPADRKHDAKLCLDIHLKPDKFIWEAKTKIIQGTENPIFGEIFTISGFSLSKLHDCALLFRLKDVNANQTIGEVTFSLRDLQPDVLTSRSCQLQRPLNIIKDKDRSYVGDLLVSLDYDPTNWKLNVRIIRARGLPKMSRGGHTDAYVKVNLRQDMTRVHKRKTRVQRHEWNPDFDEGFDFELTRDQMEATNITMKVIHRGKLRDHLIGVVLLGFNMDPMETGYLHWAMTLDKPNLAIEQWHKIYPVLK